MKEKRIHFFKVHIFGQLTLNMMADEIIKINDVKSYVVLKIIFLNLVDLLRANTQFC